MEANAVQGRDIITNNNNEMIDYYGGVALHAFITVLVFVVVYVVTK